MQNIKITTPTQSSHWEGILKIGKETLGEDYIDLSDTWNVCFIALNQDDEPVGFINGNIGTQDELSPIYSKIPPGQFPPGHESIIGIIANVAVLPGLQGSGVGLRLMEAFEEEAGRRGATFLLTEAWKYKNPVGEEIVHIKRLLQKSGFNETISIDDYWKEQCDREEFQCPARGCQCNCGVTLWNKIQ
jgi:ribosomal protein S18 acetylase RimI-like enzyme